MLLAVEDSTLSVIIAAIFGGATGLITSIAGVLALYWRFKGTQQEKEGKLKLDVQQAEAKRSAERDVLESSAFTRAEEAWKDYVDSLKEQRRLDREVIKEYQDALKAAQESEAECQGNITILREYLHTQRDALRNGKEPPEVPVLKMRRMSSVAEIKARQAGQIAIEAKKVSDLINPPEA